MVFNYDVKVKLADNKEKTIRIIVEQTNKFYKLTHDKDDETIGFLSFDINNNCAWIYKIETDKAYQHQGIGTALFYTMEYLLLLENVSRIEAKYSPENEFVKPFYLKNGYFIPNQKGNRRKYDPDWIMSKTLDFATVRSKIVPNVRPVRLAENEIESTFC